MYALAKKQDAVKYSFFPLGGIVRELSFRDLYL